MTSIQYVKKKYFFFHFYYRHVLQNYTRDYTAGASGDESLKGEMFVKGNQPSQTNNSKYLLT